jgi:hypothetical protein
MHLSKISEGHLKRIRGDILNDADSPSQGSCRDAAAKVNLSLVIQGEYALSKRQKCFPFGCHHNPLRRAPKQTAAKNVL